MKFTRFFPLFALFAGLLALAPFARAQSCLSEVDVLFYVDNSGSVSDAEYAEMTTSIRNVAARLMPAAGGPVHGAVVHYGSPAESWESNIWVESDFSADPAVVKNFTRRTPELGIEDYAAESLIIVGDALDGVANPHILSPQKKLTRRPDVPLVVFFFTDALRYAWGSSIVLYNGAAADPFEPWNDFKSKRGAKFISVVVPWDPVWGMDSVYAGAAIASVGGDYTGAIDPNLPDPDGSGVAPRWAFPASFTLTGTEIDRIAFGICELAQPAIRSTVYGRSDTDAAWKTLPSLTNVTPGGRLDYELRVENTGRVSLSGATIIDILPGIGDRGVVSTDPRGSAWEPVLTGPVSAPAGVTVFYSTSRNPQRDELTPGLPAGAEPPAWTSTLPSDVSTVRSIKIEFTTKVLAPSEMVQLQWSMRAPVSGFTPGATAWNSVGSTAVYSSSGMKLPAAESALHGTVLDYPAGAAYGDRVWLDANANGSQDTGEGGAGGIPVRLYRDNGDSIPSLVSDTLVSTTLTENGTGAYVFTGLAAGRYFSVVLPEDIYGFSPQDAGADTADSDASAISFGISRAGLMPVTTLDPDEHDFSWDAGLLDRSGTPAVWAVAQQYDGKVILGGRFKSSHGVARNNIARVNPTGELDTAFNPGTGFNGTVRSVALMPIGTIIVGGDFTSYNGQASNGFALLTPRGARVSLAAAPDRPRVRWVGAYLGSMYVGGDFSSFGRVPRKGVARLSFLGTVDPEFDSSIGADGIVNDGTVLADGTVIIVGAFRNYAGKAAGGIVALDKKGAVKTSFNPGTGASGEVFSIKATADGKFIVAGAFLSFNGTPCNGSVRLLSTGAVDTGYRPSALAVESINSLN